MPRSPLQYENRSPLVRSDFYKRGNSFYLECAMKLDFCNHTPDFGCIRIVMLQHLDEYWLSLIFEESFINDGFL
jgi:hypothetical protein